MTDYLVLLLGIACAAIGGDLFVRGSVCLALRFRISPGIVGATVAAFATSSPELSVSASAAIAGKPQLGLGDALGSNVVNVALILALALVVSAIRSSRDSIKRDFPIALTVPVITGILLLDGQISRSDGLLMLCLFFAWLVATIRQARKQRLAAEDGCPTEKLWKIVLYCVMGLALLVTAGSLIVAGAKNIALSFGIDPFVIGATIVAIGTSVPELATTVIAKLHGHDEISLGTILGSNIFNGLFIVSVASVIHPIVAGPRETTAALSFGLAALLLAFPSRLGVISRTRGIFLLILYAAYVIVIIR